MKSRLGFIVASGALLLPAFSMAPCPGDIDFNCPLGCVQDVTDTWTACSTPNDGTYYEPGCCLYSMVKYDCYLYNTTILCNTGNIKRTLVTSFGLIKACAPPPANTCIYATPPGGGG